MVTILMMSGKMTALSLKIKVFLNKDYDFIVFVNGVINKTLSRDSDYIIDVVM